MKKGVKRIIVFILVLILTLPLLIWCGALAKNGILTAMHKDEIENLEFLESQEQLPEFDWYRITSYSDEEIKIYYVNTLGKGTSGEYKIGGEMILSKTPNGWRHTNMVQSISWSGAGSADNYIWPYWHHIFLV